MVTRDTVRRPRQTTDLLLFGCWLGLLIGLIEGAIVLVTPRFTREFIRVGPDIAWMAPVAEAVLLTAIAAVLAVIVWASRGRAYRMAVGTLLAVAFFSLSASLSPLHWYSVALLTCGATAQMFRVFLHRKAAFRAVMRSTLPLVIAVTVIAAGVASVWQLGPAPGALPGPRRPNVILITLDTVGASHVSLYGYPRQTTPFLQRLAAQGTVFDRAIATSSWTLPSHASMFTGRYPAALSVDWERPLDKSSATLAEVLGRAGYRTGGFVANTIYCSYEHGLHRGFRRFSAYNHSPGRFVLSTSIGRKLSTRSALRRLIGFYDVPGRKNAAEVNEEFLDWLSEDNTGRPFFAWLNYFDAHEPYLPPQPFAARFDRRRPRRLTALSHRVGSADLDEKWTLSRAEVEAELDAYDAAIAYMDAELELLTRRLDEADQLSNTLLVITSDHGEAFGEQGLFSHGNSLYMPTVHVPLLVVLPATVPAGRRIADSVSLKDLPATIMDLLGLQSGAFPGTTLRQTWTNAPGEEMVAACELTRPFAPPHWYPVAKAPLVSVVHGDVQYIRDARGTEQLFDLAVDPSETRNVAADLKRREVLLELRQMARRLEEHSKRRDSD